MWHMWPWFSPRVSMQCWHMAESIVISLGGGFRHLGHFSHFDCLSHYNFFNLARGVGGLGDGSSDGSPNGKSDENGCEWCRSEGEVINHSLIPKSSISSSNSRINQLCFGAMTELGMKKKRCKSTGEKMVKN